MGYKMLIESNAALLVAFRVVKNAYRKLKDNGTLDFDQKEMITLRQELEDMIGLKDYYKIEEKTVEI